MEITCSRCHQTLQEGDCYCPVCGLPQLVYAAETSGAAGQTERWSEVVRDASTIDWKPAMRSALALAIPAGVLALILSQFYFLGLLLMPAAAAWVVALYMHNRRPAWITIGAGARLGLVTGILGSWTAALTAGLDLYAMRFWFHEGQAFDNQWLNQINEAIKQQSSPSLDPQAIATVRTLVLSPEGRAALALFGTGLFAIAMLAFAVAGGALGARFLGRPRPSEN